MTRELSGSVPWKWLASCLDCGEPHDYRPVLCECGRPKDNGLKTWAADDGHSYRPRMPGFSAAFSDELRATYVKETSQST